MVYLLQHNESLKLTCMNEDLFIKKIIKLEEDVADIKAHMATKDDINDIKSILDRLVGLYQVNEEERTLMHHDLKKVEKDVAKIKVRLKMA